MFNKVSLSLSFLLGTICLIVAAALVRGFCLSVLWGWLIVPVFGLPRLTIAAALGVALVINYFLRTTKEGGNILNVFAEGAVVLGLGFLFHLFI